MAADGIIVLGGGDGTLEAGLSAPALERPVLPIPSFGGKAEEVWGSVESDYRKINGLPGDFEMLRERWRPGFADLSVRTIEGLVNNNPYRSESYFPQIVLLLLIVLLIATWISLFVRPFDSKTAIFFLMSGISSLLGTGLRTSIQLNQEGTYKILWRRFLNDMTAGLLLTFGLSLIYLVGGITVTGKLEFVKLTDNDAFERIAVTMSILGLASGLLIEWASDRLRQLLTTITGKA
jgi:hypothetical protein